jgi:MFS family permease
VTIILSLLEQTFTNYFVSLVFLGLGWNFLFISGTSLLITSYRPEEKFRAQGLNDFVVFSTQAFGAVFAGFLLSILGWQLINLLCIPLLIIIIVTIFISEKKIIP